MMAKDSPSTLNMLNVRGSSDLYPMAASFVSAESPLGVSLFSMSLILDATVAQTKLWRLN